MAHDVSKLTLDDLIGNLMAYKVHMKEMRDEEQPMKRNLPLKSFQKEEDSDDSEEDE